MANDGQEARNPSSKDQEMDEASYNTTDVDNKKVHYEGEEKEYVVKFLFRPDKNENTKVASTHFSVLQVIRQVYPEVTIFNNHGRKVKDLNTLKNYNDYARNYELHFMKGNDKKQRDPLYLIFHRIHSRVPISQIRRHHSVEQRLKEHKGKMLVHHWKEDETRISNIGFFVGIDPANTTESEVTERLFKEIYKQTKCPEKKVPKFRIHFSSPFTYTLRNRYRSTKAYGLQCRQEDAKEMLRLLNETFKKDPQFMFHRFKHESDESRTYYLESIYAQNDFLSEHKVVPIEGVNEDIMFYLEANIFQIEGVTEISRHKKLEEKGRWNVHTTEANFDFVADKLDESIANWVQEIIQNENRSPGNLPQPARVAFKHKRRIVDDDDTNEVSYKTYLSSCASMYAKENMLDDDDEANDARGKPPSGSSAVTQAWISPTNVKTVLNIPRVVETRRSSATPSQLTTNDERDKRVMAENARLEKENADLREQLRRAKGQETSEQQQAENSATQGQPPTNTFNTPSNQEHVQYTPQGQVQSPPLPQGQVPASDIDRIISALNAAAEARFQALEQRLLQSYGQQPTTPSAASTEGSQATEQTNASHGPVDVSMTLHPSNLDVSGYDSVTDERS